MTKEERELILEELKKTTHPRYYKYLNEYVDNINDYHLSYWRAWISGKMSIYS